MFCGTLRSELERLEAEEAKVRERLDALIAWIETRLDVPGDIAHHHSLVRDLRRSTLQLEVSHPRATAILNQIRPRWGTSGPDSHALTTTRTCAV